MITSNVDILFNELRSTGGQEYEQLVIDLADGKQFSADEVRQILNAASASADQLQADVRKRMEVRSIAAQREHLLQVANRPFDDEAIKARVADETGVSALRAKVAQLKEELNAKIRELESVEMASRFRTQSELRTHRQEAREARQMLAKLLERRVDDQAVIQVDASNILGQQANRLKIEAELWEAGGIDHRLQAAEFMLKSATDRAGADSPAAQKARKHLDAIRAEKSETSVRKLHAQEMFAHESAAVFELNRRVDELSAV
jgi:hypothetical protein